MRKLSDISRAEKIALYMVENEKTIRQAGARFGVSKSTVHKDIQTRLKKENPALFAEIEKLLFRNKAVRHLRGGQATKLKYQNVTHATRKQKRPSRKKALTK